MEKRGLIMGEKLNLELNLLLKTPRTITDDLLKEFSKNYNMLKEKGYPIARRTVAKYRQQLNIPVARLRR